jgi:hypothetical protein
MSYFQNTEFVPYQFGTSDKFTLHQNLGVYVDLIDQVRDNNSFYMKYTILDGDRPDTLSYKLYNSTKYYWTFFLMNDNLRLRGWPLTFQKTLELVSKDRNNTVLTTRDNLTNKFKIGSIVSGSSSGASAKIIKKNPDLGQIIVSGIHSFLNTETVTTLEDNILQNILLVSATDGPNSIWRYEDSDGFPVDINPYTGPGVQLVAKTYNDKYLEENEALKSIIVIKPDVIESVFDQFQDAMRG